MFVTHKNVLYFLLYCSFLYCMHAVINLVSFSGFLYISLCVLMLGLPSLFLTPTVPRAGCLGESVALFSLPFEARPVDPVRREVFRQQVAGHYPPWFAPSSVPSEVPRPLAQCTQPSAGPRPLVKRRRRV